MFMFYAILKEIEKTQRLNQDAEIEIGLDLEFKIGGSKWDRNKFIGISRVWVEGIHAWTS